MEKTNLFDDRSRCLMIYPHSKEIILQKLSYKVYANTSSEEIDIIVDLVKNIIESNSAQHYLPQNELELDSAYIVLGNVRIFVSYWALTIDNEGYTKNLKPSSLGITKRIFDKFLNNFNDD